MTNQLSKMMAFGFVPLILLSGCLSTSTRKSITSFGESTSSLSTYISQTITDINQQQNRLQVVIASAGTPNVGALVGNQLPQETIDTYLEILSDLKTYATGLQELASDSPLADIDTASTQIYNSLNSANSNLSKLVSGYTPIDTNNLEIFATTVRTAGRAGYQIKRHGHLKRITQNAQKIINAISDNLSDSFKGCQQQNLFLTLVSSAPPTPVTLQCGPWAEKYAIALYDEVHRKHNGAKNDANRTFLDEIEINEQAQVSAYKLIGLNEQFNNITVSLQKLKTTHQAMVNSISQDSRINQKNLLSKVDDFSGEVKKTIEFHKSLKGESK